MSADHSKTHTMATASITQQIVATSTQSVSSGDVALPTPLPGVDLITFYTEQARAKLTTSCPAEAAQSIDVQQYLTEQKDMDGQLDRCIALSQHLLDECRAALHHTADVTFSSYKSQTDLELKELKLAGAVSLQLARLALDGESTLLQNTTDWVLVTPSEYNCEGEPLPTTSKSQRDNASSSTVCPEDSISQAGKHDHYVGAKPSGTDGHRTVNGSHTFRESSARPRSAHRRDAAITGSGGAFKSLFSFEVCWKW